MITVQNIFNAFVKICLEKEKIMIDPWITQGIYNGTWYRNPHVEITDDFFDDVTSCIITHIHPDHFDINAIKKLPSDCVIHFPDIYPNRPVVGRYLKDREVRFHDMCKPIMLSNDTEVVFLPPVNAEGHLHGLKEPDPSDFIVLDTGVMIESCGKRMAFLADNFPWDPDKITDVLEKVHGCDVMAVPFNAFADDYPVCFDNYTNDEKLNISMNRNNTRLDKLVQFLKLTSPGCVFPYSSDFFLKGSRAIEFDICHPDVFKSRRGFCEELSSRIEVNTMAVSSHQHILLDDSGSHLIGQYEEVDFSETCKSLYNSEQNTHWPVVDLDEMNDLILLAAGHVFKKMAEKKLESDWALELALIDHDNVTYHIDMKTNEISMKSGDENCLRCKLPSGHLRSLLLFDLHWDNERISHNLSWERYPDVYEPNISKSINYFHVPFVEIENKRAK